jgi:hypothetical protein
VKFCQRRDSATKNEALVLRDAICEALDVLDLFDESGRVVLVANGELQARYAGRILNGEKPGDYDIPEFLRSAGRYGKSTDIRDIYAALAYI